MNHFRREYIYVIIIIITVFVIGAVIAATKPGLEIIYSKEILILEASEYIIEVPEGSIQVGSTHYDEIVKLFPEGHILGRSTIYSPDNLDCLFTFTKKENILNKVHITTDTIKTARGIQVGDPLDAVIKAYGPDYSWVYEKKNPQDFDMVYGHDNNNSIVFQIRDNIVSKIVLQKG